MATCIKHKKELRPFLDNGSLVCEECIEDAAIKSMENFNFPDGTVLVPYRPTDEED